ncbi:DUF2064 domain-containing protein [Maribacter sp. MJ134]|uniref:TIGR04282 family arsenosugar biosynthesis glycosyltransferase n=1 Tax=Maribacter sp. MJ134 TaxID=2496865 RepID=UPI000F81C7BB|nr:DUF2064 domain-containing protein [Maribacter sp. MJ134]AZQ59673.1 DUF2064 domain-containing protein [Maribacter sp. MJ134]
MTNLNKTAILVFANSAKTEMALKPIQQGEALFNKLTQETLRKVKRTGLPYFHISDKEQKGHTFGERFTKAIQTIFENGFENVITVGNDTPQLSTAHLLKASHALQTGKTVLGPSIDGGFYLMGIHKANFDQETFKRLPWQRFSLFNRISTLLDETDNLLFQLPLLSDIDTVEDVKRLASFCKSISTTVLQLLRALVRQGKILPIIVASAYDKILLQQPCNKGSPLLLHS